MKIIKVHNCMLCPYCRSRIVSPSDTIHYCSHRDNNGIIVKLTTINDTCPLDDNIEPPVRNSTAYLTAQVEKFKREIELCQNSIDLCEQQKIELDESNLSTAYDPIKDIYTSFDTDERAILDKGTCIECEVTVHSQTSRHVLCSISTNGVNRHDVMTKRLTKL